MPDKNHHSAKFKSCVEKVMAGGKEEANAYAICTATFQDSGDAIYENAEAHAPEMHVLHLLGATGTVTTEIVDGREHLVVPVVALMEGVIHAVNADTPEFVPWETIERMAASFNGKPVTLGHPVSGGKQCSASLPGIDASHWIGKIRNARAVRESKKLLMETLLDKQRTAQLHPEMHRRLLDGEQEEVSVGAHVVTDDIAGDYNGKRYKAAWLAGSGDHLAFLPGKRGACSIAMGCGAHRAAMLVTAEAFVPVPEYSPVLALTTLEGQSLDERMSAVQSAINERWKGTPGDQYFQAYPMQTFDDRVIVRVKDETFSVDYDVKDGKVTLGDPKRVKQAWVAAAKKGKYEDCPTCKGAGNANGNPCETCDGEGEIRAAALVALMGLRPCSDSAKDIYGQAMKTLDGRFYGNQYVEKTHAERTLDEMRERIKFEGGQWVLYGSDGKLRLGQHYTREEAEVQYWAIQRVLGRSDQPRDDHGRWTDGGGSSGEGSEKGGGGVKITNRGSETDVVNSKTGRKAVVSASRQSDGSYKYRVQNPEERHGPAKSFQTGTFDSKDEALNVAKNFVEDDRSSLPDRSVKVTSRGSETDVVDSATGRKAVVIADRQSDGSFKYRVRNPEEKYGPARLYQTKAFDSKEEALGVAKDFVKKRDKAQAGA